MTYRIKKLLYVYYNCIVVMHVHYAKIVGRVKTKVLSPVDYALYLEPYQLFQFCEY